MTNVKELYHFTCLTWLKKILIDGKLTLTQSNIIETTDMKAVTKEITVGDFTFKYDTMCSESSDNYKPVVWLTSDIASANGVGNFKKDNPIFDKTRIRISFKMKDDYIKWDRWSGYEEIDEKWLSTLKRRAKDWRSFYICEHEIPISEIVEVYDTYEHKYIDISDGPDCIVLKK